MNDIFELFIICLMAFSNVYLPKLYDVSKNNIYQIGGYASCITLMYMLLHGAFKKYTILTLTLFIKIIPTLILTFLGFFVYKDTKFTFTKGLGMVAVVTGLIMLER
jgi:hypothetical protein